MEEIIIDKLNQTEIDKYQNEFDNNLKIIISKLSKLEEEVIELKKFEEKKEEKNLLQKMMSTTSYISSFVDNVYFLGKAVMPFLIYYKLTK